MASLEYTGNSIPAPSLVRDDIFTTDEELLYSHDHNYTQKGVTLLSGQGVLKRGTFLSRDPATKKYIKQTDPALVTGLLRKTTDTGTSVTDQGWMGNILYGAIVQLALVTDANSGVAVTSAVLGGTVNVAEGFFKF